MNIPAYIASGIIEQYVLGDVSPQEKQEVECMSHIYPEIQQEILAVQLALEGYAMEQAIPAPAHLKAAIFAQIEEEATINTPTFEQTPTPSQPKEEQNTPSTAIIRTLPYKQYFVAAASLLIVAIGGIALYYQHSNQQLTALQQQLATVQNQLADQKIENLQHYWLQANAKAPNTSLSVIWNKKTGQVYVQNVSLPATPTNKQYQLWGLKNGKPIDLGVFDVSNKLQVLKSIGQMDALAVTLEQQGGNPTPHLEELYAILNI